MEYCYCEGYYCSTRMKRLYTREYPKYGIGKTKFVAIGWICPLCDTVRLDKDKEKSKEDESDE